MESNQIPGRERTTKERGVWKVQAYLRGKGEMEHLGKKGVETQYPGGRRNVNKRGGIGGRSQETIEAGGEKVTIDKKGMLQERIKTVQGVLKREHKIEDAKNRKKGETRQRRRGRALSKKETLLEEKNREETIIKKRTLEAPKLGWKGSLRKKPPQKGSGRETDNKSAQERCKGKNQAGGTVIKTKKGLARVGVPGEPV